MNDGVLIRCDASAAVGLGHLVRCVALADELRDQGVRVAFAMNQPSAFAIQTLDSRAIPIHQLHKCAAGFDRSSAEAIAALANGKNSDAILVDHYAADHEYFETLASNEKQVFIIDDESVRNFRAVDWILNPNPGISPQEYNAGEGSEILIGPQYALLRREFSTIRSLQSTGEMAQPRVLVQFGGSDTHALCSRVLSWLEGIPKHCTIRCIIAGQTFDDAMPNNLSRHDISMLHDVANVAEHMQWADIAIGAGGSSCWELCCLGVPMVIGILSADQIRIADELHQSGAAVNLGAWELVDKHAFVNTVAELIDNEAKRNQMAHVGRELVDGLGAERAAKSIAKRLRSCLGVTT